MNCAAQLKRGANEECKLRRQIQNREQHGGEGFSRGEIHECMKRGGREDGNAVRTEGKK